MDTHGTPAQGSQLRGYLAAAGTVAIWTAFILISRAGGKSALTGYDILALRLGTASLILLPFCAGIRAVHWRDRRLWVLALLSGLIYGLLVYAGFKTAPAAHAGILLPGMQPFLVALCAWLIFRRALPRARFLGLFAIALGVASSAVPVLGGEVSGATLAGDLLLLGGSLSWAAYSVLARHWAYSPWVLTRFVAVGAAALYLPIYLLWLPKEITHAPIGMVLTQGLFQGIGPTIVAMFLFLRAVSDLGAERTGALIAMVPVLAGIAAVPLLGEPLSGWLVAGLALVSLGAYQAARPLPIPVRTD